MELPCLKDKSVYLSIIYNSTLSMSIPVHIYYISVGKKLQMIRKAIYKFY